MSSWRRYSIYKRLIAVTILSFAVQAVLMVGITYARYHSGLSQANATFEALMNKNEQHIGEQFQTMKNVAQSVGYASDVQKYFLDTTPGERVYDYPSLKYMFSLLIDANPALKAIYVMNDEGVFLEQGGFMYLFDAFQMDYGYSFTDMPHNSFFSRIYYAHDDQKKESPYCICYLPVNALASVAHTEKQKMYCAVLFDVAQLLEMNSQEGSDVEILTYDGQPIAYSGQLSGMKELLSSVNESEDSVVVRTNGRDYYARSFALNMDAPLRYTYITPMDALMGDVTTYVHFSVMMIAVCLAATICLLFSMRNSIIRPIRQMTYDMKNVTDTSGIIRPTEAGELNVLSTSVNQMLHKLRDIQKQELIHQQEFYQMNLEKTRAEMMGYRSQINPHFLFNTLECMCGMARFHGIDALENLIMAMADSYRYVLRAPDYAPLEQELAHVRNYMQIMEIRYPGKYHLEIHAEEQAASQQVLSLLLQPLVENAVLHGFADYDKDEPRTITISAVTGDTHLLVSVQDNGVGLSRERLAQIQAHMSSDEINLERKHIALQNICRRIRLSYGERGSVSVQSEKGEFTRFEIQIPRVR